MKAPTTMTTEDTGPISGATFSFSYNLSQAAVKRMIVDEVARRFGLAVDADQVTADLPRSTIDVSVALTPDRLEQHRNDVHLAVRGMGGDPDTDHTLERIDAAHRVAGAVFKAATRQPARPISATAEDAAALILGELQEQPLQG